MINLPDSCRADLFAAIAHLSERGVEMAPGLSDDETAVAEAAFGIRFPTDFRFFLRQCLPVSEGFPNWRGATEPIRRQMDWPAEGLRFDILNASFWWPGWGPRPAAADDAVEVALSHIQALPKLIPIFGHSYVPSTNELVGGPVFSIYQADVIHRGADLAHYLLRFRRDEDELDPTLYPTYSPDYRRVPFWSDLARRNWELRRSES